MALLRTILAFLAALLGLALLVPVALALLPFALVAAVTRGWMRLRYGRPAPWHEIIEYHSTIGWKPKPHLDAYCSFAGGVFHTKTDADGWPGEGTVAESDLVVFGDSYAFGYGVDAKAHLARQANGLKIKAIGSPGFNMAQELLWMREMAADLRGKTVCWLVYFGNDLYDNLLPNLYTYRMPFVSKPAGADDWTLVNDHISKEGWPFSYEHNHRSEEKFFGAFTDNGLSQRAYSACEYLIRQGKQTCEAAGAQLAVVTVPWPIQLIDAEWRSKCAAFGRLEQFDRWLPDKRFQAICARVGVPLVEGRSFLTVADHIPREGHWNARGHRRVAQRLAALDQELSTAPAAAPSEPEPLVTIGMPVYNGERFLRRSLESVLNQTYRNLEVVICDNQSTDATRAICAEYAAKDPRIRYFRNDENVGLTRNFRRVLEKATGEFFTWASADDTRPAEVIEQSVAALLRNDRAVMAHGTVIVEGRDRAYRAEFPNEANLTHRDVRERVVNFARHVEHNSMVYGLYRRELLQRAVFGDVYGQDYLVALQMCFLGPIESIGAPMITYCERKPQPTTNRMYAAVPVTLANILRVGALWKRKCWTVLLTGVWYALRLSGPSLGERLRGVAAFAPTFFTVYGSRLRRELIFLAFQPVTLTCWQLWRVLKLWPPSVRLVRKLQERT